MLAIASSLWSCDVITKVLTTVVKEVIEKSLNLGVDQLHIVVDGGEDLYQIPHGIVD